MAAGIFANANIVLQVAVFIILVIGVINARKKNFPAHFKFAYVAASLLAVSFLWMGYSFVINFPALLANISSSGSLLSLAHPVAGFAALSGGLAFALNRFITKTLIPMRFVFTAWTISLLLGIALYIQYYLS